MNIYNVIRKLIRKIPIRKNGKWYKFVGFAPLYGTGHNGKGAWLHEYKRQFPVRNRIAKITRKGFCMVFLPDWFPMFDQLRIEKTYVTKGVK